MTPGRKREKKIVGLCSSNGITKRRTGVTREVLGKKGKDNEDIAFGG